jgi:hypothetical protein
VIRKGLIDVMSFELFFSIIKSLGRVATGVDDPI